MKNNKRRFRFKVFAIVSFLMVVKLFSLGWITGSDSGSFVSPAPVFAQAGQTSAEETAGGNGAALGGGAGERPAEKAPIAGQGALDIEIIKDVEKRNKELNKREAELERKQQQLNALQTDIDKQLSELKALQAKIEEALVLRNDLEKESIRKLAKTYSSMPPESAATLIQKLDMSIAIRMLNVMKERSAGKILAATPPDLATKLSEGLVKKR
ncbi:hypothetical protein MNBD_NITROSPINAE02-1232 [hydrothermal vent metagenome]|uniref:Magnesium transporter MgtE intracellular domain-containing protein n=1 Tax=hydrothermal vent metagenome TaxID=652676 RepID=A0A3B1C8F3_9ZZZZ